MRPSFYLLLLLTVLLSFDGALFFHGRMVQRLWQAHSPTLQAVTAGLGLTDLCVATEARYTRHPAVSDPIVPFMDHPGAIEHFPTGSFWSPVFLGQR